MAPFELDAKLMYLEEASAKLSDQIIVHFITEVIQQVLQVIQSLRLALVYIGHEMTPKRKRVEIGTFRGIGDVRLVGDSPVSKLQLQQVGCMGSGIVLHIQELVHGSRPPN